MVAESGTIELARRGGVLVRNGRPEGGSSEPSRRVRDHIESTELSHVAGAELGVPDHRFAIAGEVVGCVVKTRTGLATVPASQVIGWAVKTPTGLATVSAS